MENSIKCQLLKSVKTIKNKIRMMQNEEDESNLKFKKVFKPITDPLEVLIKKNDDVNPVFDTSLKKYKINTHEDLSLGYEQFKDLINEDSNQHSEYYEYNDGVNDDNEQHKNATKETNDTLSSLKKEDMIDIYENFNVPFGVYSKNKKLMMGNTAVNLFIVNKGSDERKQYVISINDKNYELTQGLKELLLRNKPNLTLVTEKDKTEYKEILINTNAHKRDYDPNGQFKGDKGLKYCAIIKPLFSQQNNGTKDFLEKLPKLKIGGHLPELKRYKSNTDYVYWDDPNELIERLKLIIASRNAGNSNHDNEIISIIEELKEAGIIKE